MAGGKAPPRCAASALSAWATVPPRATPGAVGRTAASIQSELTNEKKVAKEITRPFVIYITSLRGRLI
jgi:hypothetical protein